MKNQKGPCFFPKDDERTGEERKEKEGEEEDQERNEEEEKERGVLALAPVISQGTMEQGSKSSDAQLEGNRVMGDMVNILVQGLDGRHLSMRVAQGTRVSVLCMDLVMKVGIPQDVFYLTRRSKVLPLWGGALARAGLNGSACGWRLRGGMDGDWTCQHCGRQGCWVTKVRCHRCG